MSKGPTLVVDIDGVLADFVRAFTELGHKMFGTPITTTADKGTWDGYPGVSGEQEQAVWQYIEKHPSFWTWLHPLATPDEFARLYEQDHVYFVTARPTKGAQEASEAWLRMQGIHRPHVIMSPWKGDVARALDATHAIDDKAGNAVYVQYATQGRTASYLVDRPYNQFDAATLGSKVRRVKTMSDFLDEVEGKVGHA